MREKQWSFKKVSRGLVVVILFAGLALILSACGGGLQPEAKGGTNALLVSAGSKQTITLPNTASLKGTIGKHGGGVLKILWSKVSGPGDVKFANAHALSTTASFSMAGRYALELTVSIGAQYGRDQVVVTVKTAKVNQPPQVSAGADQIITLPDTASLKGAVKDDGLPDGKLSFNWSKASGPGTVSFANATAQSTTASFSEAGSYVLQFTASDGQLAGSDQVMITVNPASPSAPPNQAPQVSAGNDQMIILPGKASLQGTVKDDGLPDGKLSVVWSKASGPGTVSFADATAQSTTAKFSEAGNYVLKLTVDDGQLSSSARVTITVKVNQPPQVSAGDDQTITLGNTASLKGTVKDDGLPDGELTTTWSKVSGPGKVTWKDSHALKTTASFSEVGDYVLKLTASDGQLTGSARITFTVKVANQAPQVNAGDNQTITLPDKASLQGTDTDDGLPDGKLTTTWSQVSGPGTVTFSAASSLATTASFSEAGSYVLKLSASDGQLSSSDQVNVTVNPETSSDPDLKYDSLQQLYVSPTGSDANPGTADKPLKSIMEGLTRAIANRSKGLGTRLNLYPAIYRESINRDFSNNRGPLIVIESIIPHKAIISGSDRWTDWQDAGGDVYTHTWPYNWGTDPNPWPNDVTIGELARRRELVFVNNTNLNQALSRTDLSTGSFYVDENANIIYMEPPAGTDMSTADVEVGVRPTLLSFGGLDNIVIKGLTFEHAVSAFQQSAVGIVSGQNVTIDDCIIEWNGQNGLTLHGDHLTVSNTVMNYNGSSGMTAYEIDDLNITESETSYNNWRGIRGGYTGWDVGQKLTGIHDAVISNHKSVGNSSTGLWLDWDNEDITIEGMYSCDNLVDGLFIEASQGPTAVNDSTFCNNAQYGLISNGSHDVTFENNMLTDNNLGQIAILQDTREVTNWETKQHYTLNPENWTILNNTMQGKGNALIWRAAMWNTIRQNFFGTSTINHNSYKQADADTVFELGDSSGLTLAEWQAETGEDEASTFTDNVQQMAER